MDIGLVTKAQRGDREAFSVLARTSGPWAFEVAQRILGDFDRTDDAVQEALVRAWRDLPTLRDPGRFDAWFRRLLVRACYDELRRERRSPVMTMVRTILVDEPASGDAAAALADRDELERGFRRLSPEQRVILVLRHYLGLDPAEIAETLNIPAGTARSRLHYAYEAMRAALEAESRGVEPRLAFVRGPRA